MRHVAVLILIAAAITSAERASACSFAPIPIHEIDPALEGVDTEPPQGAIAAQVSVLRGSGPQTEAGCPPGQSLTSCDDLGVVTLTIQGPEDDQSGPEEIGYVVELVEGAPPGGLALPAEPVRLEGGTITLPFSDGATDEQEPFSFVIRLTAMDRAGNLGETSAPIRVGHAGAEGGCATVSGGSTGSLVTFLGLLALIALVRRRLEASAGVERAGSSRGR